MSELNQLREKNYLHRLAVMVGCSETLVKTTCELVVFVASPNLTPRVGETHLHDFARRPRIARQVSARRGSREAILHLFFRDQCVTTKKRTLVYRQNMSLSDLHVSQFGMNYNSGWPSGYGSENGAMIPAKMKVEGIGE